MTYIDGMIAAVPTANKAQFVEHSRAHAAVLKEFGAESVVDAWGDDVPHGAQTDFHRAVAATPHETVVFCWVTWPDKAVRDAGWAKVMQDPRMIALKMPFDGKRLVHGGFEPVFTA
jgi:uncharacterized protein YbaA (DUF1428 family)